MKSNYTLIIIFLHVADATMLLQYLYSSKVIIEFDFHP